MFVILFVLLGYKVLLPSYIANAVLSESPPAYLPEKYKIQLEKIQSPIKNYSKDMMRVSDSLQLSKDFILTAIDNVDPDEVLAVYTQLEAKHITDSNEVFNLIVKEIKIDNINISLYRELFAKHMTPNRINRALRYAESHKLATSLAPNTAKMIAKQLVIDHFESKKSDSIN